MTKEILSDLNWAAERNNPSGIAPTEFKVVILPTEVGEKIGSVFIPKTSQERDQYAVQDGKIIAVSPLAFTYASDDEWKRVGASPPKVGDSVVFAKFAGLIRKGEDGKEYRIVNDKDVVAVLA
jgi:co-chaperonin GroES (HSP10)